MNSLLRPAVVALVALQAAACQTASLEDAAPAGATIAPAPALEAPQTDTAYAATGAAPQAPDTAATAAPTPTIIRRNPGFTSPVPIEKTEPVVNRDFVDQGTRRTGEFPKIGRQPQAANSQLSAAEKAAAEAEIAELLRNRAATPDARALYESRLRQLRAIADSHAEEAKQEIEN